jgi:RNA polymerase sigma-70 factor (ECF subfamily)
MKRKDGRTTSPLLLKRVADWADHSAWCDFFRNYDPLIRCWCRGYGLDDDTIDELCQQIWIRLADRMRSYQYDPGRTFRGWLCQFCYCRAIDLIRKQKKEFVCCLAAEPAGALSLAVDVIDSEECEWADSRRSLLLRQAEQAQHLVKQRVDPQTWQAFWRIAVDDCSVRETADDMGMSYAAVFAAHKRVERMLRAEGQRRLAQRNSGEPEVIASQTS